MIYRHIICLVLLVTVCSATKDEVKRKTRNPGLLHLAHVGESVGSYVDGSQRSYLSGGAGGPHIVIVGGDGARVSSHVASKDSLEELDQDIRQHYSPGGKYSSSTNFGKPYVLDHSGRTHHLGFIGHYGGHLPGVAVGHHPHHGYGISHGGGHPGLGYKIAPLLLNHPQVVHNPSYTHVTSAVGHPMTNTQHHHQAGHSQYQGVHHASTPSSINYGSPTPHTFTATPTPLTHTLATPLQHHNVPLRHPLHHGVAHGLHNGYQAPLGHVRPVFIPVQAVPGHQTPYHGHNFGVDHPFNQQRGSGSGFKYVPESYGSEHRNDNAEDNSQRYYDDVEERRTNENQQRASEYEDGSKDAQQVAVYPEVGESDKSFKYDSDENISKPAQNAALRSNFPSDDKSSLEDISSLEHSGERGQLNNFKFDFPSSFRSNGRSFLGDDKVATSYQSIVLETRSEPRYLSKKAHQ